MKKKYFDVGTFMYLNNQKRGPEIIAASIIGGVSLMSGVTSAAAASSANATNAANSRAALRQNAELFHEANEFNKVEAQKARDFSAQQAQINRQFEQSNLAANKAWYEDYNSASAQYARLVDAGLNPSSLAGNLQNSPVFSAPSGSAASGVAATSSVPPQSPVAHANPVNPMQGVLEGALNGLSTYMSAKKSGAETKGILTENQFKEELLKSGIEVNNATAKKLYQEANKLIKDAELTVKKIDEVGAIIKNLDKQSENLDVETQIKNIERLYADDTFKYQAKKLEEEYNFTKGEADTIVKLVYSKIAANYGGSAASYANAKYLKALEDLQPAERKRIENASDFIFTQNEREKVSLFLDKSFGWKDRFWDNESKKQGVDSQIFHNSDTYRVIQGVKDVSVGIGAGVGTAYGVSKGLRGMKGKYYKPAQNPNIMNGGYYQGWFNRKPLLLQ